MEFIEIPSDIKYRVKEINGTFQPQYKEKSKWVNCTHPYYDQRECETFQCNHNYQSLSEAVGYIDGLLEKAKINIHYKDTWK